MDSSPLTKEFNDALHTQSGERAIRYLDTASAYDQWAEVYDTDGNFLQALDNIEMQRLLPQAISTLLSPVVTDTRGSSPGLVAIDLGCGTGRNTIHLVDMPQVDTITAIDLSPKMLDVARERVLARVSQHAAANRPKVNFQVRDVMHESQASLNNTLPLADLVISTLVLEHVPLPTFFTAAARMLRPGGVLLMTNMHSEMGNISQAGFVDPKSGDKVRPISYAHTVEDTLAAAERSGLEIVIDADGDGVREVKMTEDLVEVLGSRSRKWVGIDVWFGGVWRKRL